MARIPARWLISLPKNGPASPLDRPRSPGRVGVAGHDAGDVPPAGEARVGDDHAAPYVGRSEMKTTISSRPHVALLRLHPTLASTRGRIPLRCASPTSPT